MGVQLDFFCIHQTQTGLFTWVCLSFEYTLSFYWKQIWAFWFLWALMVLLNPNETNSQLFQWALALLSPSETLLSPMSPFNRYWLIFGFAHTFNEMHPICNLSLKNHYLLLWRKSLIYVLLVARRSVKWKNSIKMDLEKI